MPHFVHGMQATQTEHALTKDKMKEVMAKLKKLKSFRKYQVKFGTKTKYTCILIRGCMVNVSYRVVRRLWVR